MLSAEQIQANFETFRNFCSQLGDRSESVLSLVDHFGERLALCPASSRKSFHRSIPGGLVEHSLRVLKNAMKLNKTFGWNLPKESLVLAALFHDVGKLGNETDDYYVSAEKWKREKQGELYQYNYDLPFMKTPHQSIYLMQAFGIKLDRDEFLAILLNDGFVVEENRDYCLRQGWLATCISQADYIATVTEKEEETLARKAENEAERVAKQNSKEAVKKAAETKDED